MELCNVLNHLCDIELRHRVESLVAFAEGFVAEAQRVKILAYMKHNMLIYIFKDQLRRYIDVKQSDMGPLEAARKTKEFRCPPRDQVS